MEYKGRDPNWAMNGGDEDLPPVLEDDGTNFHYTYRFEQEGSRFVDFIDEFPGRSGFNKCNSCRQVFI